ncbi:MAG: helix-turn-helix domain-containing protein [Acidiphilium sp.]
MPCIDLNDIVAFLAVARERSFTRAAALLGVPQSALSQTVRGFEARLGRRRPGVSARGSGAGAYRRRATHPGARGLMPAFPRLSLYYPSRRQPMTAFTLLVDALRYRA